MPIDSISPTSGQEVRFHCRRELFGNDTINLWMWTHEPETGRRFVAQSINLRTRDDASAAEWQPPLLTLATPDAQRLMDELWNVGIRPSEGVGSAGQLAATERHLADMRELVFHRLKE